MGNFKCHKRKEEYCGLRLEVVSREKDPKSCRISIRRKRGSIPKPGLDTKA